jgi:ribosomal protein S18 acetylase RimI-like enzyme
MRCDLNRPLPHTEARTPIQAFVASRAEVLGEAATLSGRPESTREIFARRLQQGCLCFVARAEGRLVAYNWSQYQPGDDEGSFIDLAPDEVHCLDAHTAEKWRGMNIHAALLREMLLFNAGLGYRAAYSKIVVTNRRSPSALRRLGWERTGVMLRARRVPGFPVIRLTGSVHPWRGSSPPRPDE